VITSPNAFPPVNPHAFEGQTAVVTGAASGMGLATARAFGAAGARLALVDLDPPRLDAVANELRRGGARVLAVACSVADAVAVERAFVDAVAAFGTIDVLFAAAGVPFNRPSLEITPEELRQVVDVNLAGVFLCDQAAARRMVPAGRGVIINVSSMYGTVGGARRAVYCATKAAVANMTRSLAAEWGPLGLRVNALAPGYVRTAGTEALVREGRLDLAAIEQRTPARRLATPEEMARIALFLASPEAAFVNGHVLVADGGWTANAGA
jgi:NAD(P)-dependent dehydrogenase (short-subunit alcohol dehydrogenase family)